MEYLSMLRNLLKYSKGERWKIVVYYVLHFISILGTLLQPYAFAMVINVLQKNESDMISKIGFWLSIYVLGFVMFNLFHRSARFIERYVAFRARKRFYVKIYEVLQSLPLSWHEENHTGNVMDRVNKAADSIYFFGQSQASIIQMIVSFVGTTIILAKISLVIASIALVAGAVIIYITKSLYKISVPEYHEQNEGFHKVSAALFDYIKNITTIIVLKLGKFVEKDINDRIDLIFPHVVKENKVTQLKCFLNDLLVVALNVGLIFYYIKSNSDKGNIIMAGSITAIFQYLAQLMAAINYYATDYEDIIHWNTSFEAVNPILNAVSERKVENVKQITDWNKIELGPIDFNYSDGKASLRNVNIELKRGKKIAFVGESGAGKSTLLKILCGLIKIDKDNVKIDGHKERIAELENIIAFIPQEPEIFENTIYYNITMGLSTSNEEVEKSSKIACFNTVANRLENKYETDIRENGVNLSGGEKQRLALARGIFAIKNSSIVLLDEPTSSLDSSTEMKIYKNIFEQMPEKCIVSVLHRLHLLSMFDYIYVFKNGVIIQEGTLDELKNQEGEFIKLWNQYQLKDEKE